MKLGKYKVKSFIGKGGMGQVFSGIDTNSMRKCAIKEISVQNQDDLESAKRFEREYELLSAINHPNIVKAYDFIKQNDKLFIVMEFVEGVSLEEFIKKNPDISLKEKLAICIQVCRAIEAINTAGIIHRDIKPANIMIDESSYLIKILDLGMGKYFDPSQEEKLTQTGAIMGTPQYMTPEQINGKIYENSDVFAVATTLYQFLQGAENSPFKDEGITAIIRNVSRKKVPLLISAMGEVKAGERKSYQEVSKILDHALVKNALERIESCEKLAKDLSKVYYKLRTGRTNTQVWRPSVALSPKEVSALVDLSVQYGNDLGSKTTISMRLKSQRKSPMRFVPLAIAILFVLSVIFWWNQEKDIPKSSFPDNINSKANFDSCINSIIALTKAKKYLESSKKLTFLDQQNQEYFSTTAKGLHGFIALFYQQNWEESQAILPKVLEIDEPVSIFYAIRLFIYKGEIGLARWYGNILYHKYPEFCESLQHPALEIATNKYFEGYNKYKDWQNSAVQKESFHIEAFLRISLLFDLRSRGDWHDTHNFMDKNVNDLNLKMISEFIEYDFGLDVSDPQRIAFLNSNYATHLLSTSHYIQHRRSTISFSIPLKEEIEKKLEVFARDYPLYAPTYLLIGKNLNAINKMEEYNVIGTNSIEINGVLYHCVVTSLTQRLQQQSLQYTRFLLKYRPNWHFSYAYYGEALILYKNYPEAFELICKGIKINATNIISTPWFTRNAQNLAQIFNSLPQIKRTQILVELDWYLSLLVKKQHLMPENRDKIYYFIQSIQRFKALFPPLNQHMIQKIMNKKEPTSEEYEVIAKFAMTTNNITWMEKIKPHMNSPFLHAILILDSLEKDNSLEEKILQAEQYLQEYKKNKLKIQEYPYDILYCLENYRLAMAYEKIKKYQKAIDVLSNECGNQQISFSQEIKRLQKLYTNKKIEEDISGSFNIDNHLARAEYYIQQKNYEKAQLDINYVYLLIKVMKNTQNEKDQVLRLVQMMNKE